MNTGLFSLRRWRTSLGFQEDRGSEVGRALQRHVPRRIPGTEGVAAPYKNEIRLQD